jgi:hypothetical protein
MAGFEPRSFVSQADAMTTAPRHIDLRFATFFFCFLEDEKDQIIVCIHLANPFTLTG